MKLLLDQGLPRSTAALLIERGLDAVHVGELGMSSADDEEILDRARELGVIIVTLDADFHGLLAAQRALDPSVVRLRIQGARAEQLVPIIESIVAACGSDLTAGAVVSSDGMRARVRRLPLPG